MLAFVNKNRGGCDALSHDLTNFINAAGVGASAAFALERQTVLETWRQFDDFMILVGECKHVCLLTRQLFTCKACNLIFTFDILGHLTDCLA